MRNMISLLCVSMVVNISPMYAEDTNDLKDYGQGEDTSNYKYHCESTHIKEWLR